MAESRIPYGRYALAGLFLIAGAMHFVATDTYLRIMPSYLPAPRALVLVSGACESLGGAGLLIPATRRAAAWGLFALLIAVFPANVTMALDSTRMPHVPVWAAWLRLPLQLPLLYWAWLYTRRQSASLPAAMPPAPSPRGSDG